MLIIWMQTTVMASPNALAPLLTSFCMMKEIKIKAGFAIGDKVFDFSQANLNLVFSAFDSYHTTIVPTNVPVLPPVLLRNKTTKKVAAEKHEQKNF